MKTITLYKNKIKINKINFKLIKNLNNNNIYKK